MSDALVNAPSPLRLTDEIRAAARTAAGGWLYAVDPHFEPTPDVPAYGLIGAWRVDDSGAVGGEFRDNPEYRPSPATRGWPEPGDGLDRTAQLAAAGYVTTDDVAVALLYEEVSYVHLDDGALALDENGRVTVYSPSALRPERIPEGAAWVTTTGRALAVRNTHEAEILVNPGPWRALVPGLELAARAGGEATGYELAARMEDFLAGELDARALHEAFCGSQVFCQAGERPGFLAVEDGDDPPTVPVFTSIVELARFAGQTPWFSALGQDVLNLLPDGYDVIVDAGTKRALRLRGDATVRVDPAPQDGAG